MAKALAMQAPNSSLSSILGSKVKENNQHHESCPLTSICMGRGIYTQRKKRKRRGEEEGEGGERRRGEGERGGGGKGEEEKEERGEERGGRREGEEGIGGGRRGGGERRGEKRRGKEKEGGDQKTKKTGKRAELVKGLPQSMRIQVQAQDQSRTSECG